MVRGASVEWNRYGCDRVFVLRNNIDNGGIDSVSVMLRGMNILRETGKDFDGEAINLIKTMPTDKLAVEFIGDTERNHWGNGMFDAFVCPLQNRQPAMQVIKNNKSGFLFFDGQKQKIPTGPDNIMLHAFGSDLKYELDYEPTVNIADNYVSILSKTVLHGWFSPLRIYQRITLEDGVVSREVKVINIGKYKAPWSCTTHGYFEFPADQPRNKVVLNINANAVIKTKTQPFVKNETLLPDFSKNPFIDVRRSKFKSLFTGDAKSRTLKDIYLDNCFVGLKTEPNRDYSSMQYKAKIFYPAVGWGIEVSSPVYSSPDSLHALQVYSPPKGAAAYRTAALEFAACVTSPFAEQWSKFPVINESPFFTPAGMRILFPSGSHCDAPNSSTKYIVKHRVIKGIK